MTPRTLRGMALAGVLALGVTFAAGASARISEDPAPNQFESIEGAHNYAGFVPASIASGQSVEVVLELSGDSVGQEMAEAQSQGRTLTKEEKAALRAAVKNGQSDVKSRVLGLGGTVVAEYQDALNGIAVRVDRSALPTLASTPGVAAVHPVEEYVPDNTASVQFIEANDAWADLRRTGQDVKVAIIDTGLDYTHANFGGPGTEAAFASNDGTVIEPGTFPTAKVIGGKDFVGDDYTGGAAVPKPDPDPLDCNGHGSHVGGSSAGFGVLANGSTYTGRYDSRTYQNTFRIGPGVAPKALVLAYRVFGCAGSTATSNVVAALNQALIDGADVVNMSLGSVFGRNDSASSQASNTLAQAGVVVVASAGNSGPSGYITGAAAAADRVISVAALDASREFLPGANVSLSTGQSLVALNANDAQLPGGSLPVKVLRNADGTVSLGCDPAEYVDVAGKLVVTLRGVCARVARAIFGQQAGAAAVAMINTDAGFPPFEGEITSNPDTGEKFTVTIPFLGVRGVLGPAATADGDNLVAADGGTASLSPAQIANPGFKALAGFTSGGPRNPDSVLKPDVTAPGVSVLSTAVGTGNRGTIISGTSMSSPMTAGVAALVTEAHPDWTTERIKGAIMSTADAGSAKIQAASYDPRRAGAGVVDARKAVDTVGLITTGDGRSTLSYGSEALAAAYSETLSFTIENHGSKDVTYNLGSSLVGSALGSSLSLSPSTVTVAGGGSATVQATLSLSAAAVAALPSATAVSSNRGNVVTIRGAVTATPTKTGAGVYALRIPFLVAPRGLSNVTAGERSAYTDNGDGTFSATVSLTNSGIRSGAADVYAWGIQDADDISGAEDSMDVRSVGVQEFPAAGGNRLLVFAVNTYGRWSNASVNEFDIAIDLQQDGRPDFFVVGVDIGAVLAGAFDGRFGSFVFDAAGNVIAARFAVAPANGSTALLPVLASEIGLTSGSGKATYWVDAFSLVPGGLVDTTAKGGWRAFDSPVSTGDFISLAPGQTKPLSLTLNRDKFDTAPVLGWMVVTLDDANGASQSDNIPVGPLP
jgi:minor extracellular serine protease Vpr